LLQRGAQCAPLFTQIFEQELYKDKSNVKAVITRVMAKTDDQLKLVGASDTGTTCCLAFVRREANKRTCYVANLGDTRAVLNLDGTAKRVSVDHKPTAQSEI
jgi:serine/threonine protein phosphatase PrpC